MCSLGGLLLEASAGFRSSQEIGFNACCYESQTKPNAKDLHLRSEVWCATVHLSIFGAFIDILLDCTLFASIL